MAARCGVVTRERGAGDGAAGGARGLGADQRGLRAPRLPRQLRVAPSSSRLTFTPWPRLASTQRQGRSSRRQSAVGWCAGGGEVWAGGDGGGLAGAGRRGRRSARPRQRLRVPPASHSPPHLIQASSCHVLQASGFRVTVWC